MYKQHKITIVGIIDDDELDILIPSGEILLDVFTKDRGGVRGIKGELVKAETILTSLDPCCRGCRCCTYGCGLNPNPEIHKCTWSDTVKSTRKG